MKAWVLKAKGQFELEEVEKPQAGQGEALLKVAATGICGSDIPRVYQNGAHKMPLIIGHEFSGQVVELGKTHDEKYESLQGKRVGIFPLIPCRKCPACIEKKYEMCEHYSYLGSRTDGGFAEYVRVPLWNLIELPDSVTFKQAAMMEPMSVAVHAIRRLGIKPDTSKNHENSEKTVAIAGLGTIGLFVLMFLRDMGFEKIYAVGSKEKQAEIVEKAGLAADNFVNSRKMDAKAFIMDKTGGLGVDYFFECVGKNETIAEAVEVTKFGGKICMVGNPFGDLSLDRDVYWRILRKQLTITGSWNSSFLGNEDADSLYDDWHYVLDRLAGKKIRPEELISHEFSIDDIGKGFEIMRDKSEYSIKIMMINQAED